MIAQFLQGLEVGAVQPWQVKDLKKKSCKDFSSYEDAKACSCLGGPRWAMEVLAMSALRPGSTSTSHDMAILPAWMGTNTASPVKSS